MPREAGEIDALVTDGYLESLLVARDRRAVDAPSVGRARSRGPCGGRPAGRGLVRVHPSFRFEERLAARLADAAARTVARPGRRCRGRLGAARPISVVELDLDDLGARAGRSARPRRSGPPGGAQRDPAPAAAHRRDARVGRAVDRRRRDRRLAAEPDAAVRGSRAGEAGLMPIKLPSFRARRDVYPADLWTKCPSCEEMLFNKQLDKALRVCPNCGHHFRLSAAARLEQLLDESSFEERDAGLESVDPLGFVDQKPYPDRVAAAQLATGMRDAAVWGTGTIDRLPGRDLRHGLRVHGRLDGRRRRREGHPRRRGRARDAGCRSSSCRPSAARGCRRARWP